MHYSNFVNNYPKHQELIKQIYLQEDLVARQLLQVYHLYQKVLPLEKIVDEYNRLSALEEKTKETQKIMEEKYIEILYNIPMGFELTAGMTTNYQQLKTIYQQRRHHRLPDWQMLCDWIETLPRFMELTQKENI